MIKMTESAAAAVARLLQKENKHDHLLRVGVSGGGCAGMNYSLALEDKPGEGDQVFEAHGVKMVCDPKSYFYLNGIVIDYVESMMGSGFKFENPNATKTCGCGTSFSA